VYGKSIFVFSHHFKKIGSHLSNVLVVQVFTLFFYILRIAGWKQQQNPVLYYAFHVGDQILKVAGVNVQNSVEANRAIKMVSSMQVTTVT